MDISVAPMNTFRQKKETVRFKLYILAIYVYTKADNARSISKQENVV